MYKLKKISYRRDGISYKNPGVYQKAINFVSILSLTSSPSVPGRWKEL